MVITNYKHALDDLKGFKIVHLNCQSLYNKLNQIEVVFDKIDVLCLSETWLHEKYTDAMLSLPGRKLYRWDRSNGIHNGVIKSRGGGLACYLATELASESVMINDMCLTTPHIELQTIKLIQNSHKTRYILNIYRPPTGDTDIFFHELERTLLSDNLNNQEVCILGDFNINYLKRTDVNTKKAIHFARIHGLSQRITTCTRLTGFGGSCIDLIFTNVQHITHSGVLDDIMSDHFPIYLCIKKEREIHLWKQVLGRTYAAYSKEAFQVLLSNDNWTDCFNETNPNILWEIIVNNINSHLDVMCPIKNLKVSCNKPFWLSHHIIESLNDKNKLFRDAKISGDNETLSKARKARNRTNKLVNTAKQDFIKESLDSNKTDPKKFWRIINNTLLKKNTSYDKTNLITTDGQRLSLDESCTYMNNYLAGFGETLNNQYNNEINSDEPIFKTYQRPLINMEYVITEEDVLRTINGIDSSKGSGIDFLPTFILKDAFICIIRQITYMMNQSLNSGIFPESWAIASVTPIPKTGDLTSVKNWRPISILPLPGKILEKICTKFLLEELFENTILCKEQFGFRSGLSTSHAIHHYVKYIVDGINNKETTAAIYLDFARAFDSVNYDILLLKLTDMGISLNLKNWIKGYLSKRQMCTKFNGCTSALKPLVCGVPQGSVIGPILFLCYVNDIVNIAYSADVRMTLYADDTVIYCSSDNILELQTKLQSALNMVSNWCILNRINLNINKTKPCYYGTRHLLNNCQFELKLNSSILNRCSQYKYLGVILDETMSMEANFNYIFKRLSYKVFQFSKIRHYLDIHSRILVYKQTVLPFVEYAGFLLYLNRKLDIEKLQKLQNKALRMCHNIYNARDVTIKDLHLQSHLNNLLDRREIQLLGLMYDISDNDNYIQVPRAQTRQAEKTVFSTNIVNYDIYKRSPYFTGAALWSKLPVDVQISQNRKVFISRVKLRYTNGNRM